MTGSAADPAIQRFLRGNVLVLIDAANVESSVKDLGWHIDYRKLRELFDHERLVDIRHYCVRHNAPNQDRFFTFLKRSGFKLVTKPLKIIKDVDVATGHLRKANFDVEIALDAHEMIDRYNTLVLFSGDSDFDSLCRRLRQKGKRVIVVSTKHHIARELVQSSDKYIDLKRLRSSLERRERFGIKKARLLQRAVDHE